MAEMPWFRGTEFGFSRTAHRAGPVIGEIFKRRAWRDAGLGISAFRIINIKAD